MMRRPSPVSLPYFLTAVVAVLMASFLLGAAETVLPSAGHPVIVLVEGTPAKTSRRSTRGCPRIRNDNMWRSGVGRPI